MSIPPFGETISSIFGDIISQTILTTWTNLALDTKYSNEKNAIFTANIDSHILSD